MQEAEKVSACNLAQRTHYCRETVRIRDIPVTQLSDPHAGFSCASFCYL
jgi:hypothetical protein